MPKKAKELTAIQVKRLTKPGFYSVGGTGLYLKVGSKDSRSWILRAVVGSARRDIGLGSYPDVSLEEARKEAKKARKKIKKGVDPVEEKRQLKRDLIRRQAEQITFREAALKVYEKKVPEFKSLKHSNDWINSVTRYAFPTIGHLPLAEITTGDVYRVLEPIWLTKTETATRIRQRIEAVFSWGMANDAVAAPTLNPARWPENLKELLSSPAKVLKVEHYRALPWQEIGNFMADLRAKRGIGARALEFLILTAARSGEVREMLWSEVDLEAALWIVPAEKMKAGKKHTVPLSEPALKILKEIPRLEGSNYVFPGKGGGMQSNNTLLKVVERMGVDCVPHGFRSTFKDWARSCTAYPDEVSELALAHVNSDSTRTAYARDELLPKRKKMMQDWGEFCGEENNDKRI